MVQVTGKLTDSGEYDAPNTEVKFVTTQGFGSTLRTAELVVKTDNDALYDFDLAIGKHVIYVKYVDTFEMIGSTIVNSGTPSPMSISELLNLTEPLTPDEITIVSQLVVEAREAAAEALQSEQNAAASEQEVEADRQEVAANTQTVVFAAAQVDQDKNDVTSMTAQVTSMRDEVEADRVEVSSNTDTVTMLAPQVESNAQAVAEDTLETAASAELARRWAEGDTPSGDEPSDTNNAEYWAKLANEYTTRALAWGGVFTPTSGQEYPVPLTDDQDAQYGIKVTDGDDYYTFTTGELAGQIAYTGMTLIYDFTVPDTATWVLLRSGVGTVNSINDVVPDVTGNVSLTASDVGAYSKGEVDTELGGKQDASTASKLVEPSSAIDVPVIATVAELPDYPTKSMLVYVTEVATVLVFNPETGVWDNADERLGDLESKVGYEDIQSTVSSNTFMRKYNDGTFTIFLKGETSNFSINNSYGSLYQGSYTINPQGLFPEAGLILTLEYANFSRLRWGASRSWVADTTLGSSVVVATVVDVTSRASGTISYYEGIVKGTWE